MHGTIYLLVATKEVSIDAITQSIKPSVLTIASGKGGVGKTFFSSHLAQSLAKDGKKVCTIDLDFTGPNLHTLIPPNNTAKNIAQWHPGLSLSKFVTKTHVSNIDIIIGSTFFSPFSCEVDLWKNIKNLSYDFIILDLGAGSEWTKTLFYTQADKRILMMKPEPTSIENHYHFVKMSLYHQLMAEPSWEDLKPLIHDFFVSEKQTAMIKNLLNEISAIDKKFYKTVHHILNNLRYSLVMNMISEDYQTHLGKMVIDNTYEAFQIQGNALGNITFNGELVSNWKGSQFVDTRFGQNIML